MQARAVQQTAHRPVRRYTKHLRGLRDQTPLRTAQEPLALMHAYPYDADLPRYRCSRAMRAMANPTSQPHFSYIARLDETKRETCLAFEACDAQTLDAKIMRGPVMIRSAGHVIASQLIFVLRSSTHQSCLLQTPVFEQFKQLFNRCQTR